MTFACHFDDAGDAVDDQWIGIERSGSFYMHNLHANYIRRIPTSYHDAYTI